MYPSADTSPRRRALIKNVLFAFPGGEMSVHVSSAVWKHSRATGTKLLALLSLADYANDEGIAWPSVASLATRCRITERHAKRVLGDLRADGEIQPIQWGGGRSKTTVYRITCYATKTVAPLPPFTGVNSDTQATVSDAETVTPRVKTVTPRVRNSDTGVTRSIINHQDPSLRRKPASGDNGKSLSTDHTPVAREMFGVMAEVCKVDLVLITKKVRGAINHTEQMLREAGYGPDDMRQFGDWWYRTHWKGKQNQPPRPDEVRDTWGEFMAHATAEGGADVRW